jgi:hypothetical protein
MLKLVPFQAAWIQHEKLDLHAIYRRPRFREDEYGEIQPVPGEWDLTGPLPVKQHNKWQAKGFEYVTLANRDSLRSAAKLGTIAGDWREYDQHQTGGPWNYRKYAEGQKVSAAVEQEQAAVALAKLQADVERFGWEAVEAIRQQADPSFKVPESMKTPKPARKAVA